MKAFIAVRIRAGDTKSEIEQKLVAQFGPEVLARPSKHGLDLAAWLLPLGVLVVGAAGLGVAIWKWRGLRASRRHRRRLRSIRAGAADRRGARPLRGLAWSAGSRSCSSRASRRSSHPCVLPLVPGYLSAVSRWRRDSSDVRARRVACSSGSVPFVLGFTSSSSRSALSRAPLGSVVDRRVFQEIAGLVLVVIGLAFAHLLPMPQRLVAPSLLIGARDSGSNVLLGGAFAVCAAPCVSPILVLGARPRAAARAR